MANNLYDSPYVWIIAFLALGAIFTVFPEPIRAVGIALIVIAIVLVAAIILRILS
jgi:cytochrome bd-type quinol oxidase subunit 2